MGAISVNGNLYEIGVPVMRWDEPGGYNGYSTKKYVTEVEDRKTGKVKKKVVKGKRYSKRALTQAGAIKKVSSFTIHHTGGYTPGSCFNTLHNDRKLSVHFIIDDFGTIYQTLDVIEKAWHAGSQNKCSVGVECCLRPDAKKHPDAYRASKCARLGLAPHEEIISQHIQGSDKSVYAMPKDQVESLSKLVAGVWHARSKELPPDYSLKAYVPPIFPGVEGDIPTDFSPAYKKHVGLVLHAHVSPRKWDAAGLRLREFELSVAEDFRKFQKDASLGLFDND